MLNSDIKNSWRHPGLRELEGSLLWILDSGLSTCLCFGKSFTESIIDLPKYFASSNLYFLTSQGTSIGQTWNVIAALVVIPELAFIQLAQELEQ